MFFRQTNLTDADREAEYCLPADGPGTKTTWGFFDAWVEVGVVLDALDELAALLLLEEDDVAAPDVLTVPEFK